jgi:hypothetical protein
MNMITYTLLFLVTFFVALLAVRLFRAMKSCNSTDAKFVTLPSESMVTLSSGTGQWRADRQQGFVKTGTVRKEKPKKSRSSSKATKGAVRKPWGW